MHKYVFVKINGKCSKNFSFLLQVLKKYYAHANFNIKVGAPAQQCQIPIFLLWNLHVSKTLKIFQLFSFFRLKKDLSLKKVSKLFVTPWLGTSE